MTSGRRAEVLLEMMERIEQFTLQRVWDELTDEELFWEPVPGCWGVRRRGECRMRHPFGTGEWVVDFDVEMSVGERAPLTTIGWLLWHFGSMPGRLAELDFLGGHRVMSSGWTSPYLSHHPVFHQAASASQNLRDGWAALRGAIERAGDEQLGRRTARYTYAAEAPTGGLLALGPPGAEHPATFFVVGTLDEISHHGSQVCTLRDLYAARTALTTPKATM